MMRCTCRECPDSAFVLSFTWFEALPGDAIHLQEVSRFSISIAFTQFELLSGDAIHLQVLSGFSICIEFYAVQCSAS